MQKDRQCALPVVFVPEGGVTDASFFSGISHYFGRALIAQAAAMGSSLRTIEFPECYELEEMLLMAYGPNTLPAARHKVKAAWPGNASLPERLRAAAASGTVAEVVAEYWRMAGGEILRRWPADTRMRAPVLALSPFFPRLPDDLEAYYYLDCSNAAFFLDRRQGTLAHLNLPDDLCTFIVKAERSALSRARKVFTFSRCAAVDLIRRHGLDDDHVVTVGAGPNVTPGHERKRKRRHGMVPVLFIGRDFQRKGGRTFLSVARHLPKLRFVAVTDAALSIARPANVTILPPCPQRGVQDWFGRCRLFFFPTDYEPFGLVVLEAMAHGLPVVASLHGAIPEMVTAAHLRPPGDVQGFVRLLRRMLNSTQLCRQSARLNAAQSRQWSWRQAAQRILKEISVTHEADPCHHH